MIGAGNLWMLFGLFALAIPVIVHLLNRRRFEVIDWGAMRFLQVSKITRRRLFIEEILLMLLRMGLLLLLVGAFVAFWTQSEWLARLTPRPPRDVVLVLDGSLSMNYADADGQTADQAAREWALAFVHDLTPGDNVAVIQAKQLPTPAGAKLSGDLADGVPQAIRGLSRPSGGCDWPAAVAAADALLSKSERSEKDIIVLTDGQRNGWADPDTLERWGPAARKLNGGRGPGAGGPRLWAVNVAPGREADPPNWSLAALRVNPPVLPVNCEAAFATDLEVRGQADYAPPDALRLSVDGRLVRNLDKPRASALKRGQVRVEFTHRFAAVGSHLVTLEVEPEPKGVRDKDRLPDDNVRHYAVEVTPPMPVLIVDGDPDPAPREHAKFPLLGALTQKNDPTPPVVASAVSYTQFKPELLAGANRPRVLILCNVADPPDELREAVEQFLADGGGVLVTLGGRVDPKAYNDEKLYPNGGRMGPPRRKLYDGGAGWLPARLDGVEGDEAKPDDAARPGALSETHPALERFRHHPEGLAAARFPVWWKLKPADKKPAADRAAALKSPTAEYPFLVERPYRAGRVLLCPVPLDGSWGANLPHLDALVPLTHELVYYLAGARSLEYNLRPGQPLRWRLDSNAAPDGYKLQRPTDDAPRPLVVGPPAKDVYAAEMTQQPRGALLVYGDTAEPGVYRLTTPDDRTVYYVVHPDDRESDLTACTDEERGDVADVIPVKYENDRGVIQSARGDTGGRQEWWWWVFLLGLLGLLCGEVWMTRKLAKGT